jgi:large subunit ribosomal protein L17
MRHRKAGFKLGRLTQHRWALFRNLLVALFRHERILTTEAKAKAVRGLAEHMITLAKRENLHARRQVLTMVPDPEVVKRLFDTVVARFADRHGGYTRVLKTGVRPGDAAPMVILELVDRAETPTAEKAKGKTKDEKKKDKKDRRERAEGRGPFGRRRRREQAATASS